MTIARERALVAAFALLLWTDRAPEPLGPTSCGSGGSPGGAVVGRLTELERRILDADYRADLATLARLREEAAMLADDPAWGYLARYWSGFASWRSALNGASFGMAPQQQREHLERAASEFEAALAARPDFADAYAASGSVHGWLGRFHRDETPKLLRDTLLYFTRTRKALALEPENPRALWVDASIDLFLPVEVGGDPPRAIETYRRMLAVTEAAPPAGPCPDWGRPEAFMSLAFGHLNQSPPDLEAADREARAALRLRPDWSYVRDVLLPRIAAAGTAAATTEPRR